MIELTELRTLLRRHTGTDADDEGMDDAGVDLLLNRSYWEIIDKFHFRDKEVTVTFPTIVGTRRYNLPSPFDALRKLSILDPDNNEHHVLDRMTIDEYEAKYDQDVDAYDFPTRYVREGCAVRLWPTPDAVYTMTLKYWTVLADLNDPNNTTPEIPQSWHEIILFGAVWRAFLGFGDYVRGNAAKAHQAALIASAVPVEAKEEYDSHRAGVEVPGRVYDV